MTQSSPWWDRARHQDRRGFLLGRNRAKAALRDWLVNAQDFIEADTALLQTSPGNETHLHGFKTEVIGTDLSRTPRYLPTSPEFALKKLLAAGEERIFSFAPSFRNRERGPLHAPEFTMLEWYRARAPYTQLWHDCADMMRRVAGELENPEWSWRGKACHAYEVLAFTSVEEAFERYAGIKLSKTYDAASTDRDALSSEAQRIGVKTAPDDTWSDIFSRILTERIEPNLGIGRGEILYEYPIHEAALARPVPDKPHVAERFELYVCGVELANGFGELTDPIEQRRRFEADMREKERVYSERYPIDEDFIAALAHMPPASGCALGFDRLVMLATGATHIDQVQWTPSV